MNSPTGEVLALLHAISADLGEIKADVRDIKRRVTALEMIQVGTVAATGLPSRGLSIMQRLDQLADGVECATPCMRRGPGCRLRPGASTAKSSAWNPITGNGLCPCCQETRVVSDAGQLIPPADFDSAPVHSWLICKPCHLGLSNDPHLTWYRRLTTRFRRYQAAAQAYTSAFGHRTATRMHTGPGRD